MIANAHGAIIEAGPGTIRRLCCGTNDNVDDEKREIYAAALDAVDDPVTLVDGRPIAVAALWRDLLRSLDCGGANAPEVMVVVHPSWWPDRRVDMITGANQSIAQPRSWLLARASSAEPGVTVLVEISERLVVILGDDVVAVPRSATPQCVAEQVSTAIAGMWPGAASVALIDAPSTIAGAPALAELIADLIRETNGVRTTVTIDDALVQQLARSVQSPPEQPPERIPSPRGVRPRAPILPVLATSGAVLAAAVSAAATLGHRAPPPSQREPTTFLVEGRVALTVPANWAIQRVVAGPGSARVQLTSPTDPEAALHVTQTPVPGETVDGTAERLKRALDAEPGGVFVDFNPSGTSAGRPAVTYREVRAGHHVLWTVVLDGAVRISIGCQSRPGAEDVVREVCDRAVRSARAFG
jgi:type VII secretion-associated protein (TIGR03931 family)